MGERTWRRRCEPVWRSSAFALAIAVTLGAATGHAGELRSPRDNFGLRALELDRYRQSSDTLSRVDRLRRDLGPATGIRAARAQRELNEIERDARRAQRAARVSGLNRRRADRGLLDAGAALLPFPRGLGDDGTVFGTAKAFVRIGDLLQGAERGLTSGDASHARALTARARALEEGLPAPLASDPQVIGMRARREALEERLTRGRVPPDNATQ